MRWRSIRLVLAIGLFSVDPRLALAGMPQLGLSDAGKLGVEGLSFFLMGLLISAACIQRLWNWVRRDFPSMPRLTYGKACAVVVLWGLLFVLVLTMISGARELMTPTAWEKQGLTYRVASDAPHGEAVRENEVVQDKADEHGSKSLEERKRALATLGDKLRAYAARHGGEYPTSIDSSGINGIPLDAWRMPGPARLLYQYVPGATAESDARIVAYEPNVSGERALAFLANGRIVHIDFDAIIEMLPSGGIE